MLIITGSHLFVMDGSQTVKCERDREEEISQPESQDFLEQRLEILDVSLVE